jgi:hypothetical protein
MAYADRLLRGAIDMPVIAPTYELKVNMKTAETLD